MFRQIQVAEEDRNLQRIMWTPSDGQDPVDYRLTTVTYGTTCAPYLAIRTLKKLSQDEAPRFPLGAECLLSNTYVDDIFTGADDVATAFRIREQVVELLQTAGIRLDKWAANHPQLLPSDVGGLTSGEVKLINHDGPVKTLGVCWNPSTDRFTFRPVGAEIVVSNWTKRLVLSEIARLFDPLGWLAPVIIIARIIMQDLCLRDVEWDASLPNDLHHRWVEYRDSLAELPMLSIGRWLRTTGSQRLQIHGFCDASKRTYAAAVYLCVTSESYTPQVSLLSAKTRVAPLKTKSIPHLELCGAVLLVDLILQLKQSEWLQPLPLFLWSDSEIVLAWLDKHPSHWKTFVANRTSHIQTTLPTAKWSHVPTKENPAVIATRGLSRAELKASTLWWEGPRWLLMGTENWPTRKKPTQVCHTREAVGGYPEILPRVSTFTRLARITAYCLRLLFDARRRLEGKEPLPPFLTTSELQVSRTVIFRLFQKQAFEKEIALLLKGDDLPKRSALRNLWPFVDKADGLLRVGGRLVCANLDYNVKHPPILPSDCELARLLVRYAHERSFHGGTTLTSNSLLQLAWIPSRRRLVKTTIRNCTTCQRAKPRLAHQLMGNLPAERVTPARPFSRSGLDYASPFRIRTTKGRGHKSYKGYVALFVCFVTRAIHLELVSDLTTGSFLAAYRRFTSRRGQCQELFSDNATTFKGAHAELKSLFRASSDYYKDICTSLANDGTQ